MPIPANFAKYPWLKSSEFIDSREELIPMVLQNYTTANDILNIYPFQVDKCSFHLLPKNLLLETNIGYYKDQKLVKIYKKVTMGCQASNDTFTMQLL